MGAARRIRQTMRRAVQSAARPRDESSPRGETINISDPTNIVVSGTTDRSGEVHGTSARQTVRVRQDGTEIREWETTTTETHSS